MPKKEQTELLLRRTGRGIERRRPLAQRHRARAFPGSIRKACRSARSTPCSWPCTRTRTDARPTCSRLYSEAKARGDIRSREHEQGVPFLFYNWNKYVNRNNPNEITSTDDRLSPIGRRAEGTVQGCPQPRDPHAFQYRPDDVAPRGQAGLRGRLAKQDGSVQERGYAEADNRRLRTRFNDFLLKMRDNLVPVRSDGSGVPHYETDKDAVYMPRQKDFEHYTRLCAGSLAADRECHRTSATTCP